MVPVHQEGGVYSSRDPEAYAQLHLFHLLSGVDELSSGGGDLL